MSTRIDWCDETINPLGHWCFGPGGTESRPQPCPYCYARSMAARGLRGCEECQRFERHTHFEQLDKLARWKKKRRVFVQSMGDLFHPEVYTDWIMTVFDACEEAPQHDYLFLTKNPERYIELYESNPKNLPDQFWYGYTATKTADLWQFRHADWCPCEHLFVSIEPMLGPVTPMFSSHCPADWIIIGAETGNRQGKVTPRREWIEEIVTVCEYAGIPVFMKSSLAPIWGEPLIQEFPGGLLPGGPNAKSTG